MFLEFPFGGGGGSDKNGQQYPFILDIELCTQSLRGYHLSIQCRKKFPDCHSIIS